MQAGMGILAPWLTENRIQVKDSVAIGTVYGDAQVS